MKTRNLFYRVLTIVILCAMLLPWGSGSLSGTVLAACPVTAENWHEVGTDSACAGGISNNTGSSARASVAVAPDGTPYIAWGDSSGGDAEIYVRRWNGSSWEEVGAGSASGGGISDNSGESRLPSVAIASDGTPYVAWDDRSGGNSEIYVRQWNGSSWIEIGAGSASGGGISNNSGGSYAPSVAVAPDGTPYVAWHNSGGGGLDIYVRRWNGSSWAEVGTGSASGGGISNNSSDSVFPSMAITPDGTPYVAWLDYSGGDGEIYVRRWNESSWVEVGAGSASGGGISDNSGASMLPSVAIAPDGTPYVAWYDDSAGDGEIYVRRWNGSSWVEVGSGSASGGGISDNNGWSYDPSVAIASGGMPYVAWQDCSSGDFEIYVRRWNGSSWEEVGAGSASGGGISDNSGDSYSSKSSVAVAPDGTPYVAWGDSSGGDTEIYVRRWGGDAPDTTSPATITDLGATPGTYPGDIVLSWTAPGDDGNTGTASAYIVKYWSWPITESEWIYATDVDDEPTPSPADSTETMTVNLKPRRRYYFAVKAQDEAGNTSDISTNTPSAWAAGRLISDINSDLVYDPDSILSYQVTVLAIPARTDDWTFGTDYLIRAMKGITALKHATDIGEALVTEGVTKGGAHSLFIAFKAITLHIAFDTLSQLRAQLLWGLHSTEDGDPMLLVWDPAPELMDPGVPYVITGTVREKKLQGLWLKSFYYLEVTNDDDIVKHQPSPTDPHFPIPTGYEYKYWYDIIFPGTAYGDDVCTIGMVNERYLVDDEHYVTIRLLDHRSPDAPPSGLIVQVPSSEPAPTRNSMAMFCGTKRQAAIGEEIYDSAWGTSVDYYLNTTEKLGGVEVLQGKTSTITHHEYAEEPQLAVGTGSPVDIHVYDPDGNHVGAVYDADGSVVDYENQIQGAEHLPGADDAPEVVSIINPIASSYTVVIRGTDTGVYAQTMSIHNRSGEQTYTSTLTGQPTSAGQEDTTVVSEIPAAPTGLELDVAGSTASLDWDDNTESDLAGYNVYRSTRADGVYQKMNSSLLALSSFTDSSADEHTAYYYYVTAMDTDHNESGHLPPVVSRYLIYLPLMLRNH